MCVVSGSVCGGAIDDDWTGFEAAHIVPLALEEMFTSTGLASYTETGIHSPQNGILLRADLHKMFAQYLFSINPVSIIRSSIAS